MRRHDNHAIGLVVMCVALAIAGLNFGLTLRRGDKHVSGVPVIGSVLVVIATMIGFGSALCAALGLLAVALDTGGSVWFLIATWNDSSLWDRT